MKPNKFEQLKKDILYEQSQIEIIVGRIKGVTNADSEINKAAIGTYLMNFYNGIENIMKRCSKEYYKNMPKSDDWHKKLLQQAYSPTRNTVSLFNKETVDELYDYMAFRHFFIHGYGFKLDYGKMKPLLDKIDRLWLEIKKQVEEFIAQI